MKAGWRLCPLGSIAEIKAGNSAPQAKESFVGGIHPFFRTADAGRVRFGTIFESDDYLNEDGIKGLRLFPKGTILFPKSGASTFLNHRVMLGVDGYVSSHLATILADRSQAECGYLLYFLRTIFTQDLIQDHAYPSLNLLDIASIKVILPPLPEQRRIVGILDKAFERIATAKANAEKNLQNARALFRSQLQNSFSPQDEQWIETKLANEIDFLAGFAFKSAQYTDSSDGVRLLRGDNIVQDAIRWEDARKWSLYDIRGYNRYQLNQGDVVLAMDRPWVKAGLKHAMIKEIDLPCLLVQRTARLRCGDRLNERFLKYLIGSEAFAKHILSVQTGSGVPHISGQQILDFAFKMPSKVEQCRIADNLDSFREDTLCLESIYQRKVILLDELKKSILHPAFNGAL